jgi:hypothetical protein
LESLGFIVLTEHSVTEVDNECDKENQEGLVGYSSDVGALFKIFVV